MSAFLGKDVDLELEFLSTTPHCFELKHDIGHLENVFPTDDEHMTKKKKKRVRISDFNFNYTFDGSASTMRMVAFGIALESFLVRRKKQETNLKLILKLAFADGFIINCRMGMVCSPDNRWFFEATGKLPPTFAAEQKYRVRVSVEMIDEGKFGFLKSSFNNRLPRFKSFLTKEKYCDFTIIPKIGTENDAENRAKIQCHKVFLAEMSPVFDRMLQTDCKETKENRMEINATEAGIKALLEFIYCGDVDAAFESPVIALELMDLAHIYAIGDLEKCMQELFMKRAVEWMNIDEGFNLYLQALNKDGNEYQRLKVKGICVLKLHHEKLNESRVYQHLINEPDVITNLVKCLLQS